MTQQPHSWAYIQKKTKSLIQKDTCTHMFIAALDKDLLSHKKNELMPFTATWMDLKIIILSEVSQKDHMMSLTHCEVAQSDSQRLGFARQEYWSGVPSPSPDLSVMPQFLKTVHIF